MRFYCISTKAKRLLLQIVSYGHAFLICPARDNMMGVIFWPTKTLFRLNAACKYLLYTCSNCVIVTKLLRDTFLLLQYFLLFIFFSRAHTIVAITFTQKQMNETGQSMTRTSTVNLVDLAGRYVHKSRSIQ